MDQLTNLERRVAEKLLNGDTEVLANLRRQLDVCKITKREMTGVGFFTTFDVPTDVPRVTRSSFKLGDVNATIDDLKHGAGFLLYIDSGTLIMLEGYTYDEPWPEHTDNFDLSYIDGRRDLDAVKKLWS